MNNIGDYKLEKFDKIITNRIIKNFDIEMYFIFIDKEEIIKNSSLSKIFTKSELDFLIKDKIYDELIILKSNIANFSSDEEFLIYSAVKCNYIDPQYITLVKPKILSLKKVLGEQDFKALLEWGFFDLFNYEMDQKLELKYTEFKEAFSFFESPLKPFFVGILDNHYYLFINNSYT